MFFVDGDVGGDGDDDQHDSYDSMTFDGDGP